MKNVQSLGASMEERGVSRRAFLKYASYVASLMALPPAAAAAMAEGLAKARRQSVIWLCFPGMHGLHRNRSPARIAPTLENLIFDFISLDYQQMLMAASGEAADAARARGDGGQQGQVYCRRRRLRPDQGRRRSIRPSAESAICRCCGDTSRTPSPWWRSDPAPVSAAFPRQTPIRPALSPFPTSSAARPLINISGCPPIPEAMIGSLSYILSFGKLPELDHLGRPKAFFGETIHDRCYRRPFYERGLFADSFDDEGARQGWCLYKVGCKGPVTYNACATLKWNGGVSFPIQSGPRLPRLLRAGFLGSAAVFTGRCRRRSSPRGRFWPARRSPARRWASARLSSARKHQQNYLAAGRQVRGGV